MANELVFSVVESEATKAAPVSLPQAGFKERDHLQEWVIANPVILGDDVLIITSEFDKWQSKSGVVRDRPDIIALDSAGRLVVVELKRDKAPDTVDMQAVKYAANASRFTLNRLAEEHASFCQKRGELALTDSVAKERILAHAELLAQSEESLRSPRILLVANSFPPSVKATAVWLSEMGVEVGLISVQAYETTNDTIVTASQLWPLADVEDFLVVPARTDGKPSAAKLAEVTWDLADLRRLRDEVVNPTVHTTMDLCAEIPGQWVASSTVRQATGREQGQHQSEYGGFGVTLKQRFERSNWPFERKWGAIASEQCYRLTPELAEAWLATVVGAGVISTGPSAQAADPPVPT